MVLTEHIYNQMEVPSEDVDKYLASLDEGEEPTLAGLMDFLDEEQYLSDFIYDTVVDYTSEEFEDYCSNYYE